MARSKESALGSISEFRCPICQTSHNYALEIPKRRRAILSDGQVIPRDLDKRGCRRCGATFHAAPPSQVELNGFFDNGYLLTTSSPTTSRARAQGYVDWIVKVLGSLGHAKVLEVGCGSGVLLEALSDRYPDIVALGIDPSLSPDRRSANAQVSLHCGRIDSLRAQNPKFDLILAVNVIEHVAEPTTFLSQLLQHLHDNGRIVLICPTADPPNLELMFFDHLTTFTATALEIVAGQIGLGVVAHHLAPRSIGDFQLVVLSKANDGCDALGDLSLSELETARRHYMNSWHKLEENLIHRTAASSVLRMFGAAQTAALLRAYAPEIWRRTALLTLDPPAEPWCLDRPIVPYDRLEPDPTIPMIVAVPPGIQANVAERLNRDRHSPVIWEDLLGAP